jgi:hypothetical protein
MFPSPTVGVFPTQAFDWRSAYADNHQQSIKEEEKLPSDFSFMTQENKIQHAPSNQTSSEVILFVWSGCIYVCSFNKFKQVRS